ncbi:hypothetical protein [Simiduia aestuariiviva]|uniref:Uncharacterized protein n=1 Tax=Simiduia aestuariiviva TaxID=1510459 RepID=A0A839UWQ1_9GAMM|nr:hypothetical protein [Simiduia aestuariiviva]MBB3169755.1 hypothetical protein [Simiduia aestuariiviva]
MNPWLPILLLAICGSDFAFAQDVTLGTTVTGNQEQPKVLYIIPWQNAQRSDTLQGNMDSALSDVFKLVDRTELQREIDAIETLLPNTKSPTIVEH